MQDTSTSFKIMKMYIFAILDKAKPDRKYKRLRLDGGQAYNHSRDYQGASTIMRKAFDWKRSRISMLEVEAVPQSCIP
jgi:hypothetical protein